MMITITMINKSSLINSGKVELQVMSKILHWTLLHLQEWVLAQVKKLSIWREEQVPDNICGNQNNDYKRL